MRTRDTAGEVDGRVVRIDVGRQRVAGRRIFTWETGDFEDGFEVAVAFDEAGQAVWKSDSVSLASRKRLPRSRSIRCGRASGGKISCSI